MASKSSRIATVLVTLFLGSILLSCNPWRKGSVIKGSSARHKQHHKTASSKRR